MYSQATVTKNVVTLYHTKWVCGNATKDYNNSYEEHTCEVKFNNGMIVTYKSSFNSDKSLNVSLINMDTSSLNVNEVINALIHFNAK